MGEIDKQIALFYGPLLFGSLNRSENRLCIWFPRIGKSRTLNNLLQSKDIIEEILGSLSTKIVFVYYTGTDSENAKASEILVNIANSLGIQSPVSEQNIKSLISNKCLELINQGKKIVFVGNSLENLSQVELSKLLLNITNIVRINQSKIHSILNIHFFEEIESIINKQPSILTLINSIEFMPLISNKILDEFINDEAANLNLKIGTDEIQNIKNYSGGILTLTKSLLRTNNKNNLELDLKFNVIWKNLPEIYKSVIEKNITHTKIINPNELKVFEILQKCGVLNLDVFKDKFILNQTKNPKILKNILNGWELDVYNLFLKNKNKIVDREEIAEVIWNSNEADYTDWAVDQKISRFRKKIHKYGLDPKFLETIKGRGYKWKL